MKVSPRTLQLMLVASVVTSGVVATAVVERQNAERATERSGEEEQDVYRPSLFDRTMYTARGLAIKYGLIPPPPPCGVCGMG